MVRLYPARKLSARVVFHASVRRAGHSHREFEQPQKSLATFVNRLRRLAEGRYSRILPSDAIPLEIMFATLLPQLSAGS